jgi:HEAT repeat protein
MKTTHWFGIADVLLCVIALSSSLSLADPPLAPSVEKLIESLRSNDFAERERALDALADRRASAEKYAPGLREQLRDKDQEARQQAAMALAALGEGEQAVIDELLAGMGRRSPPGYSSQPERARNAMAALVKLEKKAVPALIKAMDNKEYASRDLALEALGLIGPAAKEALPAIKQQLTTAFIDFSRTDDLPAFCQAVEVKWRIDGDAAFAIEQMVPLLDQKRGREYHTAVRTLVHMGADAKDSMPALIAALEKYKDHNLLWAVEELAPHAKELALPALREALKQPGLADDAASALQSLGEPAEELIPLHLKRLRACKPNSRSQPMRIVSSIVNHGPAAKPYIDDLIALLKHENPEVRRAAAWGVPRIFADDKPVIAALTEALNDPETTEEAAKSLKMLQEARQ